MTAAYVPTSGGTTPATPNIVVGTPPTTPTSPDPRPLILPSDYIRITHDRASSSDDVKEELANAIQETALACHRTWLYGQYTEQLYLSKNGMVYPSACPLDVAQPVVTGEQVFNPGDDVNSSASVIQGAGIWVGWFTPLPFMPAWTGVIPPQTEITYWGGFTYDTVPPKLRRIWARVAYYLLHPVVLEGLPPGAKSTSASGLSLSGDLSSMVAADRQLRKDIRGFTRRQAHSWQS